MRNLVWLLILVAFGFFAFFVLLPIIGIVIVAVLVLVIAAPFLMRLPWFRNRVFVYRSGSQPRSDGYQPPRPSLDHGDVIDVEGREVPENEKRD